MDLNSLLSEFRKKHVGLRKFYIIICNHREQKVLSKIKFLRFMGRFQNIKKKYWLIMLNIIINHFSELSFGVNSNLYIQRGTKICKNLKPVNLVKTLKPLKLLTAPLQGVPIFLIQYHPPVLKGTGFNLYPPVFKGIGFSLDWTGTGLNITPQFLKGLDSVSPARS